MKMVFVISYEACSDALVDVSLYFIAKEVEFNNSSGYSDAFIGEFRILGYWTESKRNDPTIML